LPIFGLGRTPAIAWGGTNMRAAASDLYDVTGEALTDERQTLRTRLWFDRSYERRRSVLGPVISDSPLFHGPAGRDIAVRWMGHEASDEITAFLDASRASTPEQFRAAFKTYGTGGQNMQFADAAGNIGQIMAVWLPKRERRVPPDIVLDPHDQLSQWQGHEDATTLPWTVNPPEGFLASANNPPTRADVPIGYFFITSERVRRLQQLLAARSKIGLDDLRALQVDVTSLNSIALRDGLVQAIEQAGLANEKPDFLAGLRAWNGSYDAGVHGPVLFETLLYFVATPLARVPGDARFATDWTWTATYLLPTIQAMTEGDRRKLLHAALDAAATDAAQFPTWGDMHRMRVRSVFGLIPVIGSRFTIEDYPTSGSRETVMKTAHGLVHDRHYATYGSQSRFLADMGDVDANWFVLFGGEDGWMGSANFADQMPLWRENRTMRMPLRPETIAAEFPYRQTLTPGRPAG
jgi:penicillin G amidase